MTAAIRIPTGASGPPTQGTVLVLKPTVKQVLTLNCETDAKTAIGRGIKEFLSQLSTVTPRGRELRFLKAFDTYAEAEDAAMFPSVIVDVSEEAKYDPHSFTPGLSEGAPTVLGENVYLLSTVTLVQPVSIGIWTDDPIARMKLTAMLEDAELHRLAIDFAQKELAAIPNFSEFHHFAQLILKILTEDVFALIQQVMLVVFGSAALKTNSNSLLLLLRESSK